MATSSAHHAQPETSNSSPPVTLILTVILLLFFFVGFFSIYFCRCFLEHVIHNWYIRHSPSGTPVGPISSSSPLGLDPSIIQTFPTFTYSSVKDLRKEKYGLECAICLVEFTNDSILRLLTTCRHVFHQECIDLWLECHKSCPVCRRSLDTPLKSPEKSQSTSTPMLNSMHDINENESIEDTFSIDIRDADEDESSEGHEAGTATEGGMEEDGEVERFTRSHSTGHSIVRPRKAEDRYTLILPEHVHAKLLRGRHWTKSCTTFGELKSKTSTGQGGFGEVAEFSGGDINKV